MKYIFPEGRKKSQVGDAVSHIGERKPPEHGFFPLCGRLMGGTVVAQAWVPAGKRLCAGCVNIYAKTFDSKPPPKFETT